MAEIILWVCLPIAASVGIVAGAIALARLGGATVGQRVAAAAVGALLCAADWQLVGIARGAWPTFIPHLMILATLPILFGQAIAIVRAAERRSTVRMADPTKSP